MLFQTNVFHDYLHSSSLLSYRHSSSASLSSSLSSLSESSLIYWFHLFWWSVSTKPQIPYIPLELYCTSKRMFSTKKLKHQYNNKLRIYSSYTLGRISTCNELRGPIKLACNIVTYLHNYTFYSENYIVPIWY